MASSIPIKDQLREIQRRFLTGRSGGGPLAPETLILDGDQIIAETTSTHHHHRSPQGYTLSRDALTPPFSSSHASPVSLCRSPSLANQPPPPLFALNYAPADTDREYFLTAAAAGGEATLGNIALALPPDFRPALQKTPLFALLSPSNSSIAESTPSSSSSSSAAAIANPDVLFTLLMSFKDTIEYYTHDTNGELHFLASEDEVDGQQHLIIADTTNQQVRDALVGMWCLRLCREAMQDAKNARRRGRKKMRRLARSRKGKFGKPGRRRRVREVAPVRLNRFERLRFGGRGSQLHGDPGKGTRVGCWELLPECTLGKLKGTYDIFEEVL